MSLRAYLNKIDQKGRLITVSKPISKRLELAGLLKALEPAPVRCKEVVESAFPVMGNLVCSKEAFANYLGIPVQGIIPTLIQAIEGHSPPRTVQSAPCQEVIRDNPDLDDLPIPFHCDGDGGNYISSGVMIAGHPRYGQNMDFHRCMQFSQREMAVRVVRGRHFDAFLQDLGQVPVAICVGVAPNILVAAATSVAIGVNELEIANALVPFEVVKARSSDLLIPAEAEFVIEGTVYRDRRHAEGPFVDLTETQDVIRQEPVLEVTCITHRRDAAWHALLPGGLEHKLLMGMPRGFRMGMVSAGGYHHHIGFNTWQGEGAPPPPPNALGLMTISFVLPDNAAWDQLLRRIEEIELPYNQTEEGILVTDPAGINVLFMEAK